MIRLHRRLLLDTVLLGMSLTMAVVLVDEAGWLSSLESWAYDLRARVCQWFAPPPTKELVHLDIDDRALDVVGRWPWPRARFAEILDELKVAGPKGVALDIIFPEPEEVTYEPRGNPTTAPASQPSLVLTQAVHGDNIFAAAVKRLNCAIMPVDVSLQEASRLPPITRAMHDELLANPRLSESELAQHLASRGISALQAKAAIEHDYLQMHRQTVYENIMVFSRNGPITLESVRTRLLPQDPTQLSISSPMSRLIAEQYLRYLAVNSAQRLAPPLPVGAPEVTVAEDLLFAPVHSFSDAAVATGFVSVSFFQDGAVRALPLVVEVGGKLYPQFGLALACRMLDVDPATLRLTKDSLIIPRPDNSDIVIPTRTQRSRTLDRDIHFVIDIPWFGTSNWLTMYDYPAHVESTQHVPIVTLWDVCETRRKIARHNDSMDAAIIAIAEVAVSEAASVEYQSHLPQAEDLDARLKVIQKCLPPAREMVEAGFLGDPKDFDERTRRFDASMKAIPAMLEQAQLLQTQLTYLRSTLKASLGGKGVLIGWTATAAAADFVPTSLHARCPGVVVHGAVFNAIMTQHFWRRAPRWVTPVIIILLGMITAIAAARLSPARAAAVAVLLATAYLLINGLVLFGKAGILVRATPPVLAIALVWAGGVLVRVIIEGKERALITRRFSSYADPELVDYLIEHPEQARFEGQVKELTVVFTDLQGFTTLAEKLGERAVTMLNEYMGLMVPIIRQNRGYVNKFLGDGIMFFFGAPRENRDHAAVALNTVLQMQDAMGSFNERLAAAGLPQLIMRAGLSTGEMVVGDAGSTDRSDYTVLGNLVNLGARLESGNKSVGTRVLTMGRTRELGGDGLLLRPLGNFCYMGKSEGISTFEVICRHQDATAAQKRSVELTTVMVEHFTQGRFTDCLAAITAVEADLGPGKLTKLYHELCEKYIRDGAPAPFAGNIVLSEK